MIGLFQEFELPFPLSGDNRSRAASEASVVDSGGAWIMVGKLGADFGVGNERAQLGLLGYAVILVKCVAV